MSSPHDLRLAAIRRVLSTESSLEAEAAALGVSREVFGAWVDFALEDVQARAVRRRRLARLGLGVLLISGVAVLGASPVLAQVSCSETLPEPLVAFCPNEPAHASDINSNFRTLANAVIARTGGLGADAGIVVATPGNSAVGAVTANNSVVLENRDGLGSPRLELRGGTPYIDFSTSAFGDYGARIMLNGIGQLVVDAANGFITPCRPGYAAVADGHLCVGGLEAVNTGHGAIGVCKAKAPGARVCTHADMQQACASYTSIYGVSAGWYGDVTGDDLMLTWNVLGCPNNNSGPANGAASGSLPFHCCY